MAATIRHMLFAASALTLLACGLAPGSALAQDRAAPAAADSVAAAAAADDAAAESEPALISNVFIDTDLRQALQDVAAQAGVNIIADPSVQGLVSVELNDVTVDRALELILAGTEYEVSEFPNYYLVYTADPSAALITDVARTHMFQVYHVPATTARNLLPEPLQRYVRVDEAANLVAITAPGPLLDRILRDLGEIDVPTALETVLVPLQYVTAPTAVSLIPDNLRRFVRADAERNALAVTAPYGSRGIVMDQIASIDLPRGPGSFGIPDVHRTQLVKLNYSKALATLALLPEALQAYVRADEESNTLAISAPDIVLDGILTDIAAIDVPRRHIMLEAKVVVLERADLLDFGAGWNWPTLTAGTVTGDAVDWPWELRIGYTPDREFTNALSVTLNLLSANSEATVIASPQVLAQDGKLAEIKVTTEEYFQITAGRETVFLSSDLEKIETGTILGITPQVGPNGELTLDMAIEVSDVVARGEQNLPVVSRRTAHSTVQIESGGTAAVAGLVDTRSQLSRGGVPGVSNIPLLGRAFRTDVLNHQARQVAVFVTATIVEEEEQVFRSGRENPPPVLVKDEAVLRDELKSALDRLGAGLH
jgi:type II secretory pathway component GspD/PulD (secretin)